MRWTMGDAAYSQLISLTAGRQPLTMERISQAIDKVAQLQPVSLRGKQDLISVGESLATLADSVRSSRGRT
jgi:hypothetical protein